MKEYQLLDFTTGEPIPNATTKEEFQKTLDEICKPFNERLKNGEKVTGDDIWKALVERFGFDESQKNAVFEYHSK